MNVYKIENKILKKSLLSEESLITECLKSLNKSGLQIALVTQKNRKLIGTITDGDIRRGLTRGINLKDKVSKIVNKKNIKADIKTEVSEVKRKMITNEIKHIPIVNKKNILIGLYVLKNISKDSYDQVPIIIMAGGKGSRLKPMTNKCPKPMLKIRDKPILEHILMKAKKEGFKNFFISTHYLGKVIEKYFSNGKKLNINIKYLKEKKPLGTAGSINLAKPFINKNFIVINGDVLSDVSFVDLLEFHRKYKADATMSVRGYEMKNPFGVVTTKGVKILGFEEKPSIKNYVNAGVYAFSSKIYKYLKKRKAFDMPEVFSWLKEKNKKIIIYPIHERWTDLGNKKDFEMARKNRIF